MPQEILEYIKSERVSALAVEMMDGSPHVSTVHFAHIENPLTFIFLTERKYRKAEPLFGRDASRASLVLGFLEGKMATLQLDGNVELLGSEDKLFQDAYVNKFPEKKGKVSDPGHFFFKFTPTWWRFTDWSRPEGKTIYLSDGTIEILRKK